MPRGLDGWNECSTGAYDYKSVLRVYEASREQLKRERYIVKNKDINVTDKNVVELNNYYKHKTMDFEILFRPNPSCVTDIDEYTS